MADRRPRVLVTLPDLAWPLHSGKRRRLASVLTALAPLARLDVAFLFADTTPTTAPVPPAVRVESWGSVPAGPLATPRAAARAARRQVPWQVAAAPWERVAPMVATWGPPYDLVWFGSLDHAVSLARHRWAPRVLVDGDDVETAKLRRYLAVPHGGPALDLDRLQRRVELPLWGLVQRRVLRDADAVFVCSETDRGRLAASGPVGKIRVLPNTYPEVEPVRPAPVGGCTVVLVADYANEPNVDAAEIAVGQVLPLLRGACPDAVVRLVGRKAGQVGHLAGPGVEVIGEVTADELPRQLAAAHAVLVPLRFAGGTRLKILEAFAYGVPVVSTAAGAEGLDVVDGVHALLAADPPALAAAVLRLVGDPALAGRLRDAGRALWAERYRPRAAEEMVAETVLGVLR